MAANAIGAALWTAFWAGGTFLFGGAIVAHAGSLEAAGARALHAPAVWAALAGLLVAVAAAYGLWRRRRS